MSPFEEPRAVVFDLDGTLIGDPIHHVLDRLQSVLVHYEVELTDELRREMILQWGDIGAGFFQRRLGLPARAAEEAYGRWEHKDETHPQALIAGAADVLAAFRRKKVVNTILTLRTGSSANRMLQRKGIRRFFGDISAKEDEPCKPHERCFDRTLGYLSSELGIIRRDQVLFVGDSRIDVEAGSRARIRTVIVRTGPYADEEYARKYAVPDGHLIDSVAQLPQWLDARTARRRAFRRPMARFA